MFTRKSAKHLVSTRTLGIVLGAFALAVTACSASDTGGPPVEIVIPSPPGPVGQGFQGLAPTSRPLPVVHTGGGGVIKNPHLVPIYFDGDAREAKLTPLFSSLAGSEYWKATTSEYGTGALTVDKSVKFSSDLPPSMTDVELKDWFVTQFKAATLTFDPSSLYVIFLQPHTVLHTSAGHTCVDFEAIHTEVTLGGLSAPLAIVPSCVLGATDDDTLMQTVTGLLVKTATNPYPETAPAFTLPDERSVGWALGVGSELADRCAADAKSAKVGSSSVTRSWSNVAAAAGHDPCVPAPVGPYFNVEPVFPDTMTYTAGGKSVEAKVVHVGLGEKKTIELQPFAEGQVEWTLEAKDGHAVAGQEPDLVLTLDSDKTAPFRVRHLTIERVRENPTGASSFVILSKSGSTTHSWWGVASN